MYNNQKLADVLNIQAEQDTSNMLVYFEKQFALDIISDHTQRRYIADMPELPNMCKIFNMQYRMERQELQNNTTDELAIMQLDGMYRDTMNTSLDIILNSTGLRLTDNYTDDKLETLSILLYDLFICRFRGNFINLIINYIYSEKQTILNYIQNSENKHNKDSSSIYGKKMYDNPEFATISANIELVLSLFSQLDYSLHDIIARLCPNTNIGEFILSNIEETTPLFNLYMNFLNREDLRYGVILDIRLILHQINLSNFGNKVSIYHQ